MFKACMLVAVLTLATVAQSEPAETISAGDSTFSFVTEDGLYYWLRSNKSYHIRRSQLHIDEDDYQVHPILLLEEHQSRSHIGIEGIKSHIRLTAWRLTVSDVQEKLWVIEEDADAWKWKTKTILFTKFGCCGSPDKSTTYRVKDGARLDD
jgi:hypothetical protein